MEGTRSRSSSLSAGVPTIYADNNGNVYKNSGSGWQQHTSNGWQSASGDTSWADREQQARSDGQDRFNSFSQSGGGWGSRWGGDRAAAAGATASAAGAGVTDSAKVAAGGAFLRWWARALVVL